MFVTSQFVFLHQPKTGGTFVAAILARLHEARGDRVETVRIEPGHDARLPDPGPGRVLKILIGARHQHGRRADIPPQFRDRTVVATVRSPYDRYASQFEFAWWRRLPEMFGPVDVVRRTYPRYPDLTFEDFVRLTNAVSVPRAAGLTESDTPGFHTYQFVESFVQDPETAWRALCERAPAPDALAAGVRGVVFLDQGRLNADLHAFLGGLGYDPAAIDFIKGADRIWPPEGGRVDDTDWTRYYSPELKRYVHRQERLLFERFPQFDV